MALGAFSADDIASSEKHNKLSGVIRNGVYLNSCERVLAVLELREPDRVPLYEMHVPPPISARILGREPDEVLLHNPLLRLEIFMTKRDVSVEELNKRIAKELLEVSTRVGLDWIRVVGGIARKPKQVEKVRDDLWIVNGVEYKWSGGTIWSSQEPQRYDPREVYRWSRESRLEISEHVFDVLRWIAKRTKGKVFLSFDADGSWGPIVSRPVLLRHVLTWMYRRPEVVEALIQRFTREAIEVGKWAIDEGADAIQLCVDYGNKRGPWMSPDMFRKFVKPALEAHCKAFKKKGAFVILHSDGNISPLLKDIVEAGVDAYQGIDVMAGMDLGEIKAKYGDRICLVGNVDPRVIEFGSKEDVKREVDRCLSQAGPGGGYILSASANISANTNFKNFIHMLEYARRRGKYPLPGILGERTALSSAKGA